MSENNETTFIALYLADHAERFFCNVELPCGNRYVLKLGDRLPTEDIPCPCGNPLHWFVKIGPFAKHE
jgi:hypothetical protein